MFKKLFLAMALMAMATTNLVAASSVRLLHSGDPSFLLIEATVEASDTILTPVMALGRQGDLVPAEGLVIQATSSATVAVNVDVHVSEQSQGTYYEITDDEVALAGASPQIGTSDLDGTEPFVKLEIENTGAATAVVLISYKLTERFAADEKRGTLLDRDPSLLAAQAADITLVATTGTSVSEWLNVSGKNRYALFFQPSATGLTWDIDGRVSSGGVVVSISSATAVGAVDARVEQDLAPWGIKEVRLTVDNPTGGDLDVTFAGVGLP